jgi:hypothetical protein
MQARIFRNPSSNAGITEGLSVIHVKVISRSPLIFGRLAASTNKPRVLKVFSSKLMVSKLSFCSKTDTNAAKPSSLIPHSSKWRDLRLGSI